MKKIERIFINILFVLCPLLISCDEQNERTPLYYDAWGICNEEFDPINNCTWIKSIIQDNQDTRLIIAEVIGTLSAKEETVELSIDESFYGYQIYYEQKGCLSGVSDGRYTDTYDCIGNLISLTGHIGEWFLYLDTISNPIESYEYEIEIIEYNVIYEH